MPNPSKRTQRWIVMAVLLVCGCATTIVCGRVLWKFTPNLQYLLSGSGYASFDTEEWIDASGASFGDATRLAMVHSMLERHHLVGKGQSDVRRLLGEPDEQPYLLVEQPRHAGSWIYRLGPDHLLLDSLWLVVSWDPEQRVADARIVSD